jgi:hypothetical protein
MNFTQNRRTIKSVNHVISVKFIYIGNIKEFIIGVFETLDLATRNMEVCPAYSNPSLNCSVNFSQLRVSSKKNSALFRLCGFFHWNISDILRSCVFYLKIFDRFVSVMALASKCSGDLLRLRILFQNVRKTCCNCGFYSETFGRLAATADFVTKIYSKIILTIATFNIIAPE